MPWLLLLTVLGSSATSAADVVGSTVPPYPDGLTHRIGACIGGDTPGVRKVCDYSVGILEEPNGNPRILYGARLASHDADTRAVWTITDAVPYPPMPDGYILSIATCEDNGTFDGTIFAAVRETDGEWHNDVLWARRYDKRTGKFINHSIAGVRCVNLGWGV
jgi:hypothetical protein